MDSKELVAEARGNLQYFKQCVKGSASEHIQTLAVARMVVQYITAVLSATYERRLGETVLRDADQALADRLDGNRTYFERHTVLLSRITRLIGEARATIQCIIKYPDMHDERKKAIRRVVADCRSFEQSFSRL